MPVTDSIPTRAKKIQQSFRRPHAKKPLFWFVKNILRVDMVDCSVTELTLKPQDAKNSTVTQCLEDSSC